MPEIKLKIEDLVLDHDNPRISHADGQQEALQKVVTDQQPTKLVKLAESIAEHGLNPMDRLLVLRLNQRPARYISLEGNRRVAVFKLLTNPAVMSGLDMPSAMKKAIEGLTKTFKKSLVEPISCYELGSREEAKYWLGLRHSIGHDGAGIETWKSWAKRRFEGKAPVLQALELVMERSGLTPSEQASITEKFPVSTLERFLENRSVRREIGLDVKKGKLVTKLPADEVAKPLKKIVLDLATKAARVNRLMKTEDMLGYLRTDLGRAHLPDFAKSRKTERTLDEIPISEFSKIRSRTTRRKADPSDRKEAVPSNCKLNVTQNRIADIYKELRHIKLIDGPNAIAVLLRVFLELSIDHFLTKHAVSLRVTPVAGRDRWKSLDVKLADAVGILVDMGVPQDELNAITRAVSNKDSPMHVDLLHRYVHDPIQTPTPMDLKAAWDHGQPLFQRIWP